MVLADGVVEAKELEKLYQMGIESYHLTPDEINKYIISAGTSFVKPDNKRDCIGILYEMATIAWADNIIDDTEKALLARYALYFGFNEENVDAIAEFIIQQVHEGVSKENLISKILN